MHLSSSVRRKISVNVIYSTFTRVFFIFVTFLTFFLFFGEVFFMYGHNETFAHSTETELDYFNTHFQTIGLCIRLYCLSISCT